MIRRRHAAVFVLASALALWGAPAAPQQVSMDRGVRAGELWCFPLADDPRAYVYLPAGARLATDAAGEPLFSFVLYVNEEAAAETTASSITTAGGGGVLHFLVELHTPQQWIDDAQSILRRRLEDDEVRLRGPIVFDEGRFTLVSSILRPGAAAAGREVLATGRAPVLEGNRLPFSFELDSERALLLLASLDTATPDVSVLFDMTFSGLSDAYNAELSIDWSEVKHSQAFSAGGTVYFVSADVEEAFEELRRNNAIRLTTRGADSHLEGLLDTVYSKLLDLLFRPVEPEVVPASSRGGLGDALGALVGSQGALSSRKTTGFGAYVGYQIKDLRTEGRSVLSFDHRATVERHSFVVFNIGDLKRRYGADPRYFRVVRLDDPTFQQREIRVGIDGALLPDFDRFVNSVTVTLRKQHGEGEETVRELVLDRSEVVASGGDLRMVYGRRQGERLADWLRYETRSRWSFVGGAAYETPWTTADAAMIEVFAPYERRTVRLAGDGARMLEQGVRAVVVQIDYPFVAGRRRAQVTVRPDEPIDERTLELTLPRDSFEYDYSITWQLEGGQRRSTRGTESGDLLFVDELPPPPAPAAPEPTPAGGLPTR